MRVLLVEPRKAPAAIGGDDVFVYEPLALEYVAAGIAQDHEVRILDLRLEEDLEDVLNRFRPDVVGITAYTVHVNPVRRLFDEVKGWNSETLTVVGGHHTTVVPEDFISPSIDLIVLGEGVFTFQEIVRRFEKGEGFDGISGLAFARGDRLVQTAYPVTVDLDVFPLPRRDLTAKYRAQYYSEWMRPLASIRTSKGCPYSCTFCALWKLTGGRYLRRNPERLVQELAGLDEECVFFADDESLVDARRMSRLATLIEDAGIRKRYFLYARSDTIAAHPELLAQWKEVGLERVFVGLEFWRDDDLDDVGKGSTVRDNQRAAEILRSLGIEMYASLIVRPDFSKADFGALRGYCRDLGLSLATFPVLTPLPGTHFYERVRAEMITHNYDYFDFNHTLLPTRLPLKGFYEEHSRLYVSAIPWAKRFALLRRYRLREILPSMRAYYRFLWELRTAYRDYGPDGQTLGQPKRRDRAPRLHRVGDGRFRAAHTPASSGRPQETETSTPGSGEGTP